MAGTKGAELLPEIAAALEEAMRKQGPDRVCVAFKGVHEYVDSFGALPYGKEYMDSSGGPAKPYGRGRVPKAPQVDTYIILTYIPRGALRNPTARAASQRLCRYLSTLSLSLLLSSLSLSPSLLLSFSLSFSPSLSLT